jgi:hypothetical protein
VTNQALPGRQPAHDLSAFDLSKRSPEQVARSFARWKAQRKQQAEAGSTRTDRVPSPQPARAGDAVPGESTAAEAKRASARQAIAPQYSALFSDLLAAGSEPTVQRTEWPPVAAVRPLQRAASPGRRLKVMSILAGAASVFALAGGALLELADWRGSAEVAPQMAQVRPRETPMALAAPATSASAAGWTLQHTVDVALMKAAPAAVRPAPEPPTPAIQTASKTVPVAGDKPVILPERKSATPETVQFVAKPYVPNVAPTPARSPAAQAAAPIPAASPVSAAVQAGDPRPDDLFQHGRDSRDGTASNRTAFSDKPDAGTGTGSAVDARAASARKSPAVSSGSGDPRGEGSGGARVGVAGEVGAGAASDAAGSGVGGGKSGTGDAGDVSGDGGASGSSSAGPADSGDASGAGVGDGGTGGTGTDSDNASDAGAGDGGTGDTGAGGGTGGDESGDAGDGGDSEDGESGGIGGAIGGALDAVGDALSGGKGNPDSNDKDQRN